MPADRALVNRRVAQTRAEIVDAAIALFSARGYDNVSMAEIAEAAGVSRRTIYRYFATKDDLVFDLPRAWLEVFNDHIERRGPGESTRDAFRRSLVEVVRYVESTRETVISAFSVLTASPSLQARHGRSDAEWVARYLELLAPDVADDPLGPLVATTAAKALVAAQNALIAVWATSAQTAPLIELTIAVLDQVDSVWPEGSRVPRGG